MQGKYIFPGLQHITEWFRAHEGYPFGLKGSLLKGIIANNNEWVLSQELLKSEIVVPTKSSLFMGLINKQEVADGCDLSDAEVWRMVSRHVGQVAFKDGHTLNNSENYGIHDGKVKLRDYGSTRLYKIILENQQQFRNAFQALNEIKLTKVS